MIARGVMLGLLVLLCLGASPAFPKYHLLNCDPVVFPIVPSAPWYHEMYQAGMIVTSMSGVPPPTSVRFTNHTTFDRTVPIYHLFYLGNNTWYIATIYDLWAGVPSGPMALQVLNNVYNIESNLQFGRVE